jgi:polar amino acid transport system permease protein
MYLRAITDNLELFAGGLVITIEVAIFAIVVGLVVAVITAAARLSSVAALRWAFATYVEIFRNTPLLVQILLLYLGPSELGFRLDGVQTLAVCLAINTGAYMSEIVRGGLQSVPRGQLEAAAAIGLGQLRSFMEIVLPQALRTIYPAMSNQFISVILSSSLGAIIGSGELTTVVLQANAQTYRTIELLAFLTLTYAVLSYVVALGTRVFGRRLDRAY